VTEQGVLYLGGGKPRAQPKMEAGKGRGNFGIMLHTQYSILGNKVGFLLNS